MPVTEPFLKERLWKGEIQKAGYPAPIQKPDMVLFPLTCHGGQAMIDGAWRDRMLAEYCKPTLPEGYDAISKRYWAGVEERKKAYRAAKKDLV
jgi:hypothetical protein